MTKNYSCACRRKCGGVRRSVTRAVYRNHAKYRNEETAVDAAIAEGRIDELRAVPSHQRASTSATRRAQGRPAASQLSSQSHNVSPAPERVSSPLRQPGGQSPSPDNSGFSREPTPDHQPSPPRPMRPTIEEVPDKDDPFLFSQPPTPPAADNDPDEDDDDEGDKASAGAPIDVDKETLINDIYANVSFYSSLWSVSWTGVLTEVQRRLWDFRKRLH
ncbi:hypothetical protein HYDPIDRAFT_25241 [Hydnomerulius pinastri MD-312]|nr:hypothetical protein HYDPIDRAFT_25241 [Hydnomerulius pinastri MD-312]